ncbi:beta strand repeat-containing protein [Ruminiclostridium cellobioparum]|uniref:Uncharacterized protein n=1 Tax=Ruminiclostridium cellobioparum subsp. termitidis CT1112 TaxID=1195236 RepID=S0FFT4_RUMCE|nr:hypothetical protein [Ruminiclostridium cellobioparum]EMS69950.1 hypothetical protein CTER_4340 [Ruminiclostridium cellobioparum subsp. termitidis CT1112]
MKRILSIIMVIALVLANLSLNVQKVFAASPAPAAGNIIITNNLTGKSDIIYIFGLDPGTLVKVYTASTGNKILTYGTVSKSKSEITLSVPQIGTDEGSLYISVIEKGNTESGRTKADYPAEPRSGAIDPKAVTITNNAQKSDVIYVSGLTPRDVIKVYSAETGGKLLGSKTVSTSGSDVTITVPQVGSAEGSVYVTVTSKGYLESKRTEVPFKAEPASAPLDPDNIVINNNAKSADTVYIPGLSAGDVVKIYNDSGKVLATKTVGSSAYDATISVPQLGVDAGIVYITVTSKELAESSSVPVEFEGELASEKPNSGFITVTNNSGKADTVYVTGLSPSDVVKVYNKETKGSLLGQSTVTSSGNEATVSIPQLGSSSGVVYVTVTNAGRNESQRVKISYSQEGSSTDIAPSNITVTNNVGKADTVYVSGLVSGDVVKVYDAEYTGNLLGSATVAKSATDVTISISQLGTDSGSVYVSITTSGKLESSRVPAEYLAESKSNSLDSNSVTVTNNSGAADTIYVTGLTEGTLIKVYNAPASGSLLGSATVATSKTDATVTISQLGIAGGSVYLTITQPGAQESGRTKIDYSAEGTSTDPNINNISISNNVGKADTIYVSNLTSGDIVRIYNAPSQGNIIGTATVASSAADVTVSIAQLGTAAGSVYVTVSSTGKAESKRTKADYKAESVYVDVDSSNITVTNNAGKADTVYFTRLSAGDVVKVYDSLQGGTLLGSATVAAGSTDTTVSIPQLGKGAGSVFVTVSSTDKSESARKEVTYTGEASSVDLSESQIVVTNNISGTPDTIYVSGLSPEDVVKAYSAQNQGILLGSATVPAAGTDATITVTQLGTANGSVYITVTSSGKLESNRTKADYSDEGKSTEPDSNNITINNNSGAADTVRVTGLTAGDVVRVYSAETGGNLLGSATVTTYSSEATVTITQLGTAAGKVYVTVAGTNKAESKRITADYDAEPVSGKLDSARITVTNNAGSSDTVRVTGLTPGDIVKVYSLSSGGNLLGSATVSSSSTEATVEIAQLGTAEGKVFVTVTSVNKAEGERTDAAYKAEEASAPPDPAKVSVANNYGIASTITVGGLKDNDVVSIYSAESGGILLGKGTVATYNSEVTISVSQLSDTGGDVYITVTTPGKLESNRAKVTYEAKATSTPPDASNVEIYNNVGFADTITVFGMEPNAVIKVYTQATGGNPIGTATVPADSTEATISITQLGVNDGVVYISVTTKGKTESGRAAISYTKESASEPLAAGNVKITNNSGMSDTIVVTGLLAYDTIKIYNSETDGTRLATAVADENTLAATANISQLGTGAGKIYITVTNYGRSESARTAVEYEAESTAPLASNIFIVNNAGIADTITVKGLNDNDVVKVYDAASNGNLIGAATVPPGSSMATMSVTQLTSAAGKVYVSVTNYGRAESSLTKAEYISETSTMAPYIGDIYIVNNVDINDTITVYNLLSGDVVKVYDSAVGGNLLGNASVANNKTEATVSVEDLGSAAGTVYVSVITKGKTESVRTEAGYVAESRSTAPYAGNIYITNNVTLSDIIQVSGLTAGDKVKVYDSESGGELLGSATASSGSDQVKITVKQLGESAGSVYVSVTSKGKTESKRTEAEYVSEQTTNEPYAGYISVSNNPTGTSDTVTVTNLNGGDIINVYSAAAGGSLLGSATVASGSTTGTVVISQLGTASGSVYISITSAGKAESNRTKADYLAE